MLEDRDYMRQPEYGRRLSLTVALIVINAIVYLFELSVSGIPSSLIIEDNYFALSVEGLKNGFVWQLLTFQFMHAGLWHLVFNCWAIYVFGRAIEETLGWKKFLILYLSSGVVGGICQVLAALLWPDLFGGPVVGASAGGFGLMAAFAVLFPERELVLLLFFISPIRDDRKNAADVIGGTRTGRHCFSAQPHRQCRASGRNADGRDFHPPVCPGPRVAMDGFLHAAPRHAKWLVTPARAKVYSGVRRRTRQTKICPPMNL